MTPTAEQRNRYKGSPERGWVRVSLVAPDGTSEELELLADTGNPFAIIVNAASLARTSLMPGPSVSTNFGLLIGGYVRVFIADIGFDEQVLGYASDTVAQSTQRSSPDFGGLLGLPLLRRIQYEGDADWFWIRPPGATP